MRMKTLADVLERFADYPPERIRTNPAPGTATARDVDRIHRTEGRLYELDHGVLVEKTVGFQESYLASDLARVLGDFVERRDLGIVMAEGGMMKLIRRQVRIPDAAFFGWHNFPDRLIPETPVPRLYPDLAIEILSRKNTKSEMARKLKEYFEAGAKLVWYVHPRKKFVDVFTTPDEKTRLTAGDVLTGGSVLPGFSLPLSKLFARIKPGRSNSK